MEHLASVLFLLLRLLTLISALARNLDPPRYDTAYACEGKILKIECREGQLIQLIRANYGRFSITICNDHGNTEWSVNCMSPKSLRVLHTKCMQQQNCSIPANTSLFGDPCPGTLKYLEAHYRCIPATTTTTTSRPSPPWLIASQPSVWSTAKLPTLRPPSHPHSRGGSSSGSGSSSSHDMSSERTLSTTAGSAPKSAVPREPPPTTRPPAPPPEEPNIEEEVAAAPPRVPPEPAAAPAPASPTTTSSSPAPPPPAPSWETSAKPAPAPGLVSDYTDYNPVPTPDGDFLHLCPPVTARNLEWNWTRAGEVNVQPCPGGAAGVAKWRCIRNKVTNAYSWAGTSPDLSECKSLWLTSLDSRIEEGDAIISIANDLSQVTSSKTLYGGDMMATTNIVKKMTERMAKNIQTFPDPQQREAIVTELLQSVVKTTSNLLDSSQEDSWKDLNYAEQMGVATSLLIGLEENAFLLADTVIREKTVIQTVKNILLSVRVMETGSLQDAEQFPGVQALEKRPDYSDWLQVPRSAMLDNSEGGFVRLVFVAFERLEEILKPNEVVTAASSATSDVAGIDSAVMAASDAGEERARNTTRIVNSKIISASLGKGRHIQFSGLVRLGLRHIRTENVSNPTCVFWDYTTSAWSEEGCQIELTNRTHTICRCNHLTNFAVLMDVDSTYIPPPHSMTLQIITYIGCIVSIVCLLLAIITFQLFRGLKSDRTTIHKNLCTCLLLAEVLFLLGISQTDKPIICGVVAGLLHFVFLCAFAWMFLEGFQLYVMLIEVFEAEKSRIRWYYMFAYGSPLVIVCVSCVVDPLSYGTERYCWLRADNFFIFSFVGPVIAVILANLVFLSMAIYMMCRHSNSSVSMKSKEHSRLASARTWLRGAIVLVFLLGLTWTFGLLYLNEESDIMAYIFTILNSLQGLFIFFFHCFQNEKVRKEYKKWNSWLPKCVKCKKYQGSSGGGAGGSGAGGGVVVGVAGAGSGVPGVVGPGQGTGSGKERRSSVYGAGNSHAHSGGLGDLSGSGLPNGNSSKIYFKSHNNDIGQGHCIVDGRNNYHGGLQHDVTLASLHSVSLNLHPHDRDVSYGDRSGTLRSLHGGEGDVRRQQYRHGADKVLVCELERQPHGSRAATLQLARRRRDHYGDHHGARRGDGDDPVYEEIRQAASDASDEELRRGVASRQSLRSYGDHSPLIPSPHALPDPSMPLHLGHAHVAPDPHGFLYSPRSHALPIDR